MLKKEDIMALIYTDIDQFPKGYLDKTELSLVKRKVEKSKFAERKYNQHRYAIMIFSHLSNVYTDSHGTFYIDEKFIDESEKKSRDPYLQKLYKSELIEESKQLLGKEQCVLEKRKYPVLIASHIKPYRNCDRNEEFDNNNGLLLSKNMDSLFDLGYISFDDFGNVIPSKDIDPELAIYVKQFTIDNVFLTTERKYYLDYHRSHILRS